MKSHDAAAIARLNRGIETIERRRRRAARFAAIFSCFNAPGFRLGFFWGFVFCMVAFALGIAIGAALARPFLP